MNLLKTLTWNQLMQLLGLAAVSTLVGVGTIDVNTGLPFITGLIGLAINTAPAAVSTPTVTVGTPAPKSVPLPPPAA